MKIETSTIEKIRLTEVEKLDPIDVFWEATSPTSGKVTINCYGKSWTSFWPAVGEKGIKAFFKRSSNCYIIGYLDNKVDSTEPDWDAYKALLVQKARDASTKDFIRDSELEDVIFAINSVCDDSLSEKKQNDYDKLDPSSLLLNEGLSEDVINDFLDLDIDVPTQVHHQFAYLSRIVDAVKASI
jgi:hypothetical protein